MTNKKYNKRYENLPPWKQFLHKNTGFLVMGTVVTIIAIGWTLVEAESEFFHSWNCEKLAYYMVSNQGYGYPDHDELTEEQHIKLHKLYANDCSDQKFIPIEEHGTLDYGT